MVTRRPAPRGMSLQTVLLVVTIMTLLAATMTSLFMVNLNFTQGYFNGDLALNEAEAGLAELQSRLSVASDFGTAGSEEIRGRCTRDATDKEAWHLITFRRLPGFPYSTNNLGGVNSAGYLGRTVPPDTVHVFSVGYCRGQYRTVEALVVRPAFPLALGSAGPITSLDALVIKGVSNSANAETGDDDRPGHLVCNSPLGVKLQRRPGTPVDQATRISGFIKSVGPVVVDEPAEVRGGIRAFADVTPLPQVDLARFRNQGKPGVVTIFHGQLPAQTLDVMYYCGHDLVYTGPIDLENAFLFVDGSLKVQGAVRGTGAIVTTKDLTIENGSNLVGTNRLALLAGGNVTLQGADNFLQGFIWAGGGLRARRVTVLGAAVSNSPTAGVVLEQSRIWSNSEYSNITFAVSSSSDAKAQNNWWNPPIPLGIGGSHPGVIGIPPGVTEGGSLGGWTTNGSDITGYFKNEGNWGGLKQGDLSGCPPDAAGLVTQLQGLLQMAQEMVSLKGEISGLGNQIADGPDNRADLENEKRAKEDRLNSLRTTYDAEVTSFADSYMKYYREHADKSGKYKTDGKNIDVQVTYEFPFDEFLPASERVKVTAWRLHQGLP